MIKIREAVIEDIEIGDTNIGELLDRIKGNSVNKLMI